jgi:hypothetical protein
MKSGRSLVNLAKELERQLTTKRDMMVPSPMMRYRTSAEGIAGVEVDELDGVKSYGITQVARRQLADKLGIPYCYFERMRAQQPDLLDENVNTWLQAQSDNRLIRILEGQVRAVLSERYRRLDNWDLAEHVIPILQRLPQARFESVELTETKMYLKVVTPVVFTEVVPGDVLQAGVVISNSEVGWGTLSVQPLVYRLVCRNGLIAPDAALRKTHIGRVLDSDEASVLVFKDDTLQADDRALFLKVRDVVEAAVSEAALRLTAEKMRKTLEIKLTGDLVRTVEILGTRYGMSQAERAGVLRSLIEQGQASGYGLVNAVTGYSQEIVDYDRATEFEAIGGKLIESTSGEWRALAEAA